MIENSSIKAIDLFCVKISLFQVIALCERLAGQDANVTTVPVTILRFTRQLTRFFEWTNDVADRLAFSEVISGYFSLLLISIMLHEALC